MEGIPGFGVSGFGGSEVQCVLTNTFYSPLPIEFRINDRTDLVCCSM